MNDDLEDENKRVEMAFRELFTAIVKEFPSIGAPCIGAMEANGSVTEADVDAALKYLLTTPQSWT